MRSFAQKAPVLFSALAIFLPVLVFKFLGLALKPLWSELAVKLVLQGVFCGYVALLTTGLGMWSEVGLRWPAQPRRLAAFLPWLLLPLLMAMGSGLKAASLERIALFATFTLMVGFVEEVLLRGVVLGLLRPGGLMRAVWISSALFGLAHFAGVLDGRDPRSLSVQLIYATFIGVGLAGPRLFAGTLLPAIAAHALIDFTDFATRGFTLAVPRPFAFGQALVVILLTGPFAIYGCWMTRKAEREATR